MSEHNQIPTITPEEEAAAKLLQEKGWTVSKPSNIQYGCFCELETCAPGTKPDGCVIDDKTPELCIYAPGKTSPSQCEYWKAWSEESVKKFWEDIHK